MKSCRMLLGTVALWAAAAGCTKVEDLSKEQVINFAVGTYAQQTKATALNNSIDNITSFRSKAFVHPEGSVDGTVYFNSAITWEASIWAPEIPYYWPKHPLTYLNFVSWYDNGGDPTTATETKLEWENRTIGESDNILFADEAWHFKSNTSNAAQYSGDPLTSGVPTLFHHALAKVKFQIRAYPRTDDDSRYTYEVATTSVSLSSVHKQGTMTLSNSDLGSTGTKPWTASNTVYLWNATDSASDIALTSGTIPDSNEYTTILNRSVLPQNLTDATVLTITYSITTKFNNGSTTTIVSTEKGIQASIQLNTLENESTLIEGWLPNKIYTYSITINPVSDRIIISPAIVSDWEVKNTEKDDAPIVIE